MANKFRIITTTTVTPTTGNDHSDFGRRIDLSPRDLQLLLVHHIQKGLLFHKPTNDNDNNNLIRHLKATLSQTLDIFYPLAGRLAAIENDDNTTSFSIDCNGAGALTVHAAFDGVTVADILNPLTVPDDVVYSFFSMNRVSNFEGAISRSPLVSVQITELEDGIFVACSMNHCVCDGTSFWQFFNTWSEISRRNDVVSLSPSSHFVSGRDQLIQNININLPIHVPVFHHDQQQTPFLPLLQQKMLNFSKEKIAQLKSKANAEMTTMKISSLQALMAYLWISISRNRRLNTEDEVFYGILVGLRQRMQPPLPEKYLGNAVRTVLVRSTVAELVEPEGGLGCAAWKINRVIASQTASAVGKFLESWEKSTYKLLDMGKLPPHSLLTGSSPRFDVYGNDFGYGRPLAVRSGPGDKFDGKVTVFPGAEEEVLTLRFVFGLRHFRLWNWMKSLYIIARVLISIYIAYTHVIILPYLICCTY